MPSDLRISDFLFSGAQALQNAAQYAGTLGDKLYEAERVAEIAKAQTEIDRNFLEFSNQLKYDIFGNPNEVVDPANPPPPRVVGDLNQYQTRGADFLQKMLSQVSSTYKNPDAQKAIINYISNKGVSLGQHIEDNYNSYRISKVEGQYNEMADSDIQNKPANEALAMIKSYAEMMKTTGVKDPMGAYQWVQQKQAKVFSNVRGDLLNSRNSWYEQVSKGTSPQIALDSFNASVDNALKMGAISQAEADEKKTLFKAEARVAGVIGQAYEKIMPQGDDGKRKFVDNLSEANDVINNSSDLLLEERAPAMQKLQAIFNQQKSIDQDNKAKADKTIIDPLNKDKDSMIADWGSGKKTSEQLIVEAQGWITKVQQAQSKVSDPNKLSEHIAFGNSLSKALQDQIDRNKAKTKLETREQLQTRVQAEKAAFDKRLLEASPTGAAGAGSDADLATLQDEIIKTMGSWGEFSEEAVAMYGRIAGLREGIARAGEQADLKADGELSGSYDLQGSQIVKGVVGSNPTSYDAAIAAAQKLQEDINADTKWNSSKVKASSMDRVTGIIESLKQQKQVAANGLKALSAEEAATQMATFGDEAAASTGDKAKLEEILKRARGANWGNNIDKLWTLEARVKTYIADLDDVAGSETYNNYAAQVRALEAPVNDYYASGFNKNYRSAFDSSAGKVAGLRSTIEADTKLTGAQKQKLVDELGNTQKSIGGILGQIASDQASTAKAQATQSEDAVKQTYNSILIALTNNDGKIMDQTLASKLGTNTVSVAFALDWIGKNLSGIDPDKALSEINRLSNWKSDKLDEALKSFDAMFEKYKPKGITEAMKVNEKLALIEAVTDPKHVFDMPTYMKNLEERIKGGLKPETVTQEVLSMNSGYLNDAGNGIMRRMFNGDYNFQSNEGTRQREIMANALVWSLGAYLGLSNSERNAIIDSGAKQAAEFTKLSVSGVSRSFYGVPVVTYKGKTYAYVPEKFDSKGNAVGDMVLAEVKGSVATKVSDTRTISQLTAEITSNDVELRKSRTLLTGEKGYFPAANFKNLTADKNLMTSLGLGNDKDITRDDVADAIIRMYGAAVTAKAKKDKNADSLAQKLNEVKIAMVKYVKGGNLLDWTNSWDMATTNGWNFVKANDALNAIKNSR